MALSSLIDTPLYYRASGFWIPLPSWAHFFIELGLNAAATAQTQARLVVGLSVPSRSFAAAFSSMGIITALANHSREHSESEHFVRICSLPTNTPVSIVVFGLRGTLLRKKGVFVGTTNINGCI